MARSGEGDRSAVAFDETTVFFGRHGPARRPRPPRYSLKRRRLGTREKIDVFSHPSMALISLIFLLSRALSLRYFFYVEMNRGTNGEARCRDPDPKLPSVFGPAAPSSMKTSRLKDERKKVKIFETGRLLTQTLSIPFSVDNSLVFF